MSMRGKQLTGTRTRRPTGPHGPSAAVAILLLGTELLLISLSICAAVLDQSALAVMAGTAAVTLAGEIVRRYLTPPTGGRSGLDGTTDQEPEAPAPPPGTHT
ncbi:hypothetical protein [Plantactinospora sp. WMMB782]|uniref:hypothetical protein n=1 Tax=Plantactinospora sp. WMMB782 TaxID=3404121 RepID=UPI003B92E025